MQYTQPPYAAPTSVSEKNYCSPDMSGPLVTTIFHSAFIVECHDKKIDDELLITGNKLNIIGTASYQIHPSWHSVFYM
jgi:hypothetical protein